MGSGCLPRVLSPCRMLIIISRYNYIKSQLSSAGKKLLLENYKVALMACLSLNLHLIVRMIVIPAKWLEFLSSSFLSMQFCIITAACIILRGHRINFIPILRRTPDCIYSLYSGARIGPVCFFGGSGGGIVGPVVSGNFIDINGFGTYAVKRW